MAEKTTSPWLYVGCGCLALVVLAFGTCAGIGFFGYNQVKTFTEEMADPVLRNAKALEMLGAEALPDGYQAQMVFTIPWVMKMAVLSDLGVEVTPEEFGELDSNQLGDNSLFYFEIRDFSGERGEVRDFIRGESDELDLDIDIDVEIDFDPENVLERGEFEIDPVSYYYAVYPGDMEVHDGRHPGLQIMTLIECPRDERLRLAVWFRSHPEDQPPEAAVPDLATPVIVEQFMSHFTPCAN